MTTSVPLEELLRQAIDRLALQERRMAAIEARLAAPAPFTPAAPNPPATVLMAPQHTPPLVPWPRRPEPSRPQPQPDRVKDLEARLAEAEERLRVGNRLETVGRLVAGVAHDFNNLLTVIAGNAEVIQIGLPEGDALREHAEHIAAAAQTAANITRQLVNYSRPSKPEAGPVDANVAVRAIERTLRRLAGERVTLECCPAATVPLIRADAGQFDQVLLNLVVNARDAIPADGTVTPLSSSPSQLFGLPW